MTKKQKTTMKHTLIYVCFALMFLSCGDRTQKQDVAVLDEQNIIVLDDAIANPIDMDINEVAADIDYIQLETTDEILISTISKIQIRDGKIYVLDDEAPALLVFDMSGKFIRKIGNRGQGPGEYVGPLDMALCDSVILAMDQGQARMILYDTLGGVMAEKYIANNPPKIAFLKGMPAYEQNYPDFAYNDNYRISTYDRKLQTVTHFLKSKLSMDENSAEGVYGHTRSFFANVDDTLTFWEAREDIVYKIIDENTIVKRYKFEYENKAKFEDGMGNMENGEIDRMLETPNHIFFTGGREKQYWRLIHFKKTGKSVALKHELKNPSGIDFFPEDVTEDGRLYNSFSVYSYKTKLGYSKTSLEHLDPKLRSLVETCDFDDNPCIMLVTLK